MKVLLLNPKGFLTEECCTGKIYWNSLPSQIFLAASFLKKMGKDVKVIDAQTQKVSFDDCEIVVVWVSLLDGFYDNIRFLENAKSMSKKTIMILNDAYEGIEMEAMSKYSYIDACVRLYEREISLNNLVSCLEEGNNEGLNKIRGIIYRKNGDLIDTGKHYYLKDLHHLSSCEYFLKKLPLNKYQTAFITSGRGCRFGCKFCLFRGTYARKRRIEDVISEVETVHKYIKIINILDLDMFQDITWTYDFCSEIIRRNIKFEWSTDVRADECNIEILSLMRQAGCTQVVIGVESISEKILSKINKGINVKAIQDAIRNCKKVGIIPCLTLMIGFPWDSDETFDEMYKFLKANPTRIGLQFVIPIRGTPLYEDYKRLGLLKKDLIIDDYVNMLNAPLYDTLYTGREKLLKWNKKLKLTELNIKRVFITLKKGIKLRHIKRLIKLFKNR